LARRIFDANTGIKSNPPGTTTTTNPSSISSGDSSIRREQVIKGRSMDMANNLFN